jgi:outer membrane protein assembly factor BamA
MTVIPPKRPIRFSTVSAIERRFAAVASFAIGLAALLMVPGIATAQNITCDEPGDIEVRGLEFRGNRTIDSDDLALRITTTPSSWGRRTLRLPVGRKRCLDRAEVRRDILRLKAYYRDRGFYETQVDTVITPAGRHAVKVAFTINEGEPIVLDEFRVTGLDSVPDGVELRNQLQLKVGQPFDFLRFGADMDTIVRKLRDAGYYRAQTIPGYDSDTVARRAKAYITVVPGVRARFGPTEIKVDPVSTSRGQQIDDSVVSRILGITPGTFYSDRAIVQAQRNLYQLGTYQHIDVAPLPDSAQPPGDSTVVLSAQLIEDYMRQLDSEVGWGTLDCGRMRLQFTDRNFLHQARRLELTGQASKIGYGEPVQTQETRDVCTFNGNSPLAKDSVMSKKLYYFVGGSIRQPRLLGRRLQPTLSLYSERRGEYKAYRRTTQVGSDLSATQEIGNRMPLRIGYTFEWGQTDADPPAMCALFNLCDEDSRQQVSRLATLGVASANLSRVRTDNAISPRRGTLMRAEIRSSATKWLGTSRSLFFNKGTADVAWYVPIGQNVLAARLRGGAVLGRRLNPNDPTGFIPPQERLYAGGPTSVRGFQQNELGKSVYIARNRDVQVDTLGTFPNDTLRVSLKPDNPPAFDTDTNPERAVPLGGNALFVANLEYRIRDPFLFPDRLQYTLFLDGGDVWTRASGVSSGSAKVKWTPGIAIRALTPVGPFQFNVGWNRYDRESGPLYYNPDVGTLACVSGGTRDVPRDPKGGFSTTGACDEFKPPPRRKWYQKLTFTFSLGPDF